jgi:hypothetical protein
MTDSVQRDEESLIAALRDLYAADVLNARADVDRGLTPRDSSTHTAERTTSAAIVVLSVVTAAVLVALVVRFSASDLLVGNFGAAHQARTPLPSPHSSVSLTVGPLVGGIPVSVNGEPVLRGAAIGQRIAASRDTQSFLIGGWFHAGQPVAYCPTYLIRTPWYVCSAIPMYDRSSGGALRWIYPGDPPRIDSAIPIAANRAAVIRIHTHDESCPATMRDCASWPVMLELVWLGSS